MAEEFKLGPLQTAWLEALESGKYEQGHHYLKRNSHYCCLGVLCELVGLPFDEKDGGFVSQTGLAVGALPYGTETQAGLRGRYGSFKFTRDFGEGRNASGLADMNDDLSASFAEIAAYIRHDPHNVFERAA